MEPHPVMTPGVIELKFSPRRPLINFYLHTKFERDRMKNDRAIESESRWEKNNKNNNNNTQKTEQKHKGLPTKSGRP